MWLKDINISSDDMPKYVNDPRRNAYRCNTDIICAQVECTPRVIGKRCINHLKSSDPITAWAPSAPFFYIIWHQVDIPR